MNIDRQRIERKFFRGLNAVVEPAVRVGINSPRFAPAGLILLETVGFKTGQQRRTPLMAMRLGGYTFISTFRGDRSFWLKNLQRQPHTRYYLGGKLRESTAMVVASGSEYHRPKFLPPDIGKITNLLSKYTRDGWGFAVLMPAT